MLGYFNCQNSKTNNKFDQIKCRNYSYISTMTDLADLNEDKHSGTSNSSLDDGSDVCPPSLSAKQLELALNKEATEDELIDAINHCKEVVLDSEQLSVERKWLVRHLIELRLHLQEYREAMNDSEHPRNKIYSASKRTIRGHHLILQPIMHSPVSGYCDHCTGAIWSVVQTWYECEDCSYSCHYKCLSSIVRECAHVVVSEKGTYEFDICPEDGLSAQQYQCAECKAPLPLNNSWGDEPRLCDYTGRYYCMACHWEGRAVIPARVVRNWDLEPRPVCQAALQQLRITARRPIINLEKINPRLFSMVQELGLVKRLRTELIGMKRYLTVCRKATEDHVVWKHLDTPHLIDSLDMYSLQDLVDTNSGELPSKLHTLVDIFSNHIKVDCEICKGRAHICVICLSNEVVYPFDATAHNCSNCNSVMHKVCYTRKNQCPKCLRIMNRMEEEKNNNQKDVEDDKCTD